MFQLSFFLNEQSLMVLSEILESNTVFKKSQLARINN